MRFDFLSHFRDWRPSSTTRSFARQYRSLGLRGIGCSNREIAALEGKLGLRLPTAYRAFLQVMGRLPNRRFTGTDCSLNDLLELQEWAKELLEENGHPFQLPAHAFVFLMHQGYQFMYFLCEEGLDDPPVYYYLEGNPGPIVKAGSFSILMKQLASQR